MSQTANAHSGPTALPLTGLRVVDAADVKGELCGRMLADFGADVIRLEPPAGAASRRLPPFADDGETSLYFAYRNFNKRGLTLDLDVAADRAHLLSQLAGADIYIDSAQPGSHPEGLDPAALVERFPHLIVCSITDFGQTGERAQYAATDATVFAMSGWLAGSGIPDKPPLLIPGPQAYDVAAIAGCFATLTALVKRRRTGRGQHLDVSALEAMAQCNTWQIPNASASRNAGGALNTLRSGSGVMYPAFATRDGFVRLVVLAPRQWNALFEWMGSPEQFADPMWADTVTRVMNHDVLNPAYAEFFAQHDMVECGAEAQRRGVVATPMLTPQDVLANEHYASRQTFTEVEVAPGTTGKVVDGFMEIGRERIGFRFRAPAPGEHNAEILATAPDPISLEGQPDDDAPLAGLRVIDFGHGGVGVEGGRMLADYGADVIKIESRTYPDFMRLIMGTEMTPSFASSSRSKRSFGVDAKHDEGLPILHQLIATADIAIENNSTGTLANLGVGYEVLSDLNPNLTLASSQMMGAHGTYSSWIGYGPTIQPVSGLTWLWAFDDGEPPPGSTHIHPDHMAGRLCAIAGLLGVLSRDQAGRGFHVEMAQVENLMAVLGDFLLAESIAPGTVTPQGNHSSRGAPWGVYPCAGEDDWCVITVRDDDEWRRLGTAMGSPAWATDARFASAADRLTHRDELDQLVATWTAVLPSQETMALCQAQGVAAGAMLTAIDHLDDAALRERGFIVDIDQPAHGPLTLDGGAFIGSDMPPARVVPAPLLGEHTRELCAELGIDAAEVDRLMSTGALAETPATDADAG